MYYLGTITGASGGYSNHQTGASGLGTFVIPRFAKSLYLVPSASGVLFQFIPNTGATGGTAQAALGTSAQLAGPGVINGPYRMNTHNVIVSIYNSAGGFVSCRVFAEPSS